jgi:chromosome segregation ATPase
MNAGSAFTDLRMNRQEADFDGGFWPSFTDIMTVIVMIFLLAMMIVLLRNMELTEQLRITSQAENIAQRQVFAAGEKNHSLTEQLSRMQDALTRAETLREQQEAAIASQQHQIAALNRAKQQLTEQTRLSEQRQTALQQDLAAERRANALDREAAQSAIEGAQQALSALQAQWQELDAATKLLRRTLDNRNAALQNEQRQRAELAQRHDQAEQSLLAAQREYAKLNADYAQAQAAAAELEQQNQSLRQAAKVRQQTLEQALAQLAQTNSSLSALGQDYSALELRYNELIQPARTAKGRFVVEVRVAKKDQQLQRLFRTDKNAAFEQVTHDELENALQQLKRLHAEGLYVRVIIPDESGLSYKEAWDFTREMHRKYDYYYTDDL